MMHIVIKKTQPTLNVHCNDIYSYFYCLSWCESGPMALSHVCHLYVRYWYLRTSVSKANTACSLRLNNEFILISGHNWGLTFQTACAILQITSLTSYTRRRAAENKVQSQVGETTKTQSLQHCCNFPYNHDWDNIFSLSASSFRRQTQFNFVPDLCHPSCHFLFFCLKPDLQ